MPFRFFEDFSAGQIFEYGSRTIRKDEMIAFAEVYDPQPMHTDEVAARQSFVGTLIASGWHTISLSMRMIVDHLLGESGSMGASGVSAVRWIKPVLPGDTLSSRVTILDTKASASRPDRGFITMTIDTLNQRGEIVMQQTNPVIMRTRAAAGGDEWEAERLAVATKSTSEENWYGLDGHVQDSFEPAGLDSLAQLPRFEALEIGTAWEFGAATFSESDIIRFGRAFDPQPFHIDAAAGAASHFGGVTACGWQTAGCWMRLMYENRLRRTAAMLGRNETPPEFGPSPGFKDMRWLKPVQAGDRITFRSTVIDKRLSQSRPGWALVSQKNQGFDEAGQLAFEFIGTVFWQV